MGWDWEWRWCHHSRSWEQHWIWVGPGQFGDDYLAASTGVVADTGGSEDPGWQQQEQHWQGWWAAEDGPDGSQEDTQAWQGWSGWRSHGREHTTGQPGQPWHDEAWRRDRASQGSTQERGPVGDTGGAHSARAFPSQGKGTPSVHRQDRSLEKAYRKNAEARAKRDPEAKRVSRSSFLRNRQRAPKSRRLGKGQGKASRADPPNQSLVRPPGVRSPPPARQKADARAKQELGSAASSSHRGNGPAAEDRLEEAEAKETESSSSSSSSSPVGGPVPESRQQGTQAQAEMPSTSGQGPGAAPPSTEDLSPWSRRLMRKTTAVKTLPRPPSTTSSSGTEPPPRQKASAAAEDRPKPEAKVVPNTMEVKSSPVHRDEAGAAEEEATTESPQDVTMVQGPSEVLTAAVHQEPQATAAAAEEEKDPNDPPSPTSPADGVEGDEEAQDAAAPPLEVEALAPAAAANPPTEARSAAQAYPGQGVEGAAAAAASAAVDELASAAPRARNKGNPPTTEPSGTGLLLEVECRSGIQAEWIGLGCKPSVKAAAILSHCRDRTGMQELDTLSIWPDGSTLDLRVAIGDSLRAGETKLLATGPVGSGTAASSSHGDPQPAGGIQATQGKGSPPPQVLTAAFDAVQREAPEVVNPSPHGPRPVTTADGLTCLACGISTATVEHMQAHFMTRAHVEAVRRYQAP